MADNKMGPNIQAGAGFLAKRVQKSLNRAQEKVLQKLGKTMETKDEQFEQCSQNLSKQQADGVRLSKDVRAYFTAVKAMHESSKRLSQTLKDVYEPEWNSGEDLSEIIEKEDLMWNDYEEKMSDQVVRTMENYTSQFPEVKERVSKRGRKLVDYDSTRHHLEALQCAKKKDEGKIAKAEDEFNKAQNVFEELNNELREELPVLYQSRIGCYVTVFQNISNLRDIFYKEMSVLNHDLYNVMKQLETQHSGKAFIIKGLNSTKSKKRKSLIISNPIPCNTAFPADHVSMHSTGPSTDKDDQPSDTLAHTPGALLESGLSEVVDTASKDPTASSSTSSSTSSSCDLDNISSNSTDGPKSQSACPSESAAEMQSLNSTVAEADLPELCSSQSDDSGVGVPTLEAATQEVAHPLPPVIDGPRQQSNPEQKEETDQTSLPEVKTKAPPIPAPRISFGAADRLSKSPGKGVEAEKEVLEAEKQEVEAEKKEVEAEKKEVEAEKQEGEAEKKEVEAEKKEVEAEKQEVEAEKKEVEAEKQEVEAEKKEVEAEKKEVEAETDAS